MKKYGFFFVVFLISILTLTLCAIFAFEVIEELFPLSASNQAPPLAILSQKKTMPIYKEESQSAGINFTYRNGEEADNHAILESVGGGVAVFDCDNDGWMDIFLTGGGKFTGADKKTIQGLPNRLYKNLRNGRFIDLTKQARLDIPLFYSNGCAAADFDNDGWTDLLVTGFNGLALYHNKKGGGGKRRFINVTKKAGLKPGHWTTSAAWGDLDGDGFADLYICQYVNWSFANHPIPPFLRPDIASPRFLEGLQDFLYRNNGDGTFTEVGEVSGVHVSNKTTFNRERILGRGLGVILADFNNDQRPDIYVANDTDRNFLFMNRSKWMFEESGCKFGAGNDSSGVPNGSSGIAVADIDGSGIPSLWVTNYEKELHALYHNSVIDGKPRFLYKSQWSGTGRVGNGYVGKGTAFLDFDNDGNMDLVAANGHVLRHPARGDIWQKANLFRNTGIGKFREFTDNGGKYFDRPHRGRGLATGDFDNDGRIDVVVSHLNEPAAILRNVFEPDGKRHHWLGLELKGKNHRNLVGTKIVLHTTGRRLTRFVTGGGSYLSSSDPRILFGLGPAKTVQRLSVHWAYGQVQHWKGGLIPVDQYWRLFEGEIKPRK